MRRQYLQAEMTLKGTKFKSKNPSQSEQQPLPDAINECCANNTHKTDETLDLADLDLSRLRLTKKDLETLSSITPGLPKIIQDQLLAQLPPNQARKLSRTLSMQNNTQSAQPKVYKRSLSNGRTVDETPVTTGTINSNFLDTKSYEKSDHTLAYRRSLSRCRYETADRDTRSSSNCRSGEESKNQFAKAYPIESNDKYKTYHATDSTLYSSERQSSYDRPLSPYNYYDTLPPRSSCMSPTKDFYGRPPSGCLSPPPCPSDISLRRRSTQRKVSRFLRPDFYDTPIEDSVYVVQRDSYNDRQKETQRVLREIREKSREKNIGPRGKLVERVDYATDEESYNSIRKNIIPYDVEKNNYNHALMRNVERDCGLEDGLANKDEIRRRSLSKSRDVSDPVHISESTNIANASLTDTILDELQHMSILQKKKKEIPDEDKRDKSDNVNDKKNKIKKIKSKEKPIDACVNTVDFKVPNANDASANENQDPDVGTSVCETDNDNKIKKESKLVRPKSYPNKDPEKTLKKLSSPDVIDNKSVTISKIVDAVVKDSKLVRPKSYPSSKITPPKETKKFTRSGTGISAVMEKLMEKTEKVSQPKIVSKNLSRESKSDSPKSGESSSSEIKMKKVVKKVIKIADEAKAENSCEINSNTNNLEEVHNLKEKSPEKKTQRGFLYSIGQKFEKLRETSKGKDKKNAVKEQIANEASENGSIGTASAENNSSGSCAIKKTVKKKSKLSSDTPKDKKDEDKAMKSDRKSRIDAMIRNLRDRSVPRGPELTESGLIKRAVSVEDMSGAFNKCSVNKMLGLFKKFEKDNCKVKNTKSVSNMPSIENANNSLQRERPKSSSFVSKLKKTQPYSGAKSDSIVTLTEQLQKELNVDNKSENASRIPKKNHNNNCPDCKEEKEIYNVTKRHSTSNDTSKSSNECKERMKNNRKGLVLDFTKIDKPNSKQYDSNDPLTNSNKEHYVNGNSHLGVCNGAYTLNEINRNHQPITPNYEYLSDTRSPYDDCASTSTFLSPSEDPELCFDDWSVCSDDHYIANATPSPTRSHVSRNSAQMTPSTHENASSSNVSESVIDRIKRKSFYMRFNEKKPRRQSNLVGPGAREYYREAAARLKSRPPDRVCSPPSGGEINENSQEYASRAQKLSSSIETPTSPIKPKYLETDFNNYRSSDFTRSRPCTSSIPAASNITAKVKAPESDFSKYKSDLLNFNTTTRSPIYDSAATSSIYGTYKPIRRSSATSSSVINLDSYATLGRKTARPYANRTTSLLDSSIGSSLRREIRAPSEISNTSTRTNVYARQPSMPRSPTHI